LSALASFLQHLAASCTDDTFVRLSLSSPTRHDAPVQRILARLIDLHDVLHLSFTLKEERRDTTQNVPLPDAFAWVERKLGREFRGAMLATTTGDWQLQLPEGKDARLIRHKPAATSAPLRSHDGQKPTFLGAAALPWLRGLGIVDQDGRPRKNLADKRVQIDRYVEILAHLARDCGFDAPDAANTPLHVVDVGCGKGHLTFAAWHLCKHVLHRMPRVVGVERRDELVANAGELAGELAPGELSFVCSDIEQVALDQVDVLVALHACNTATDHAIRRGVAAQARLIVVAPCCHQEVRPQLGSPAPLDAVLRHGLFAERMAEWVTDGLRMLVLEAAGYRTKVIEFVGGEHTAKNVMLAAVRADTPAADRAATRRAIDSFRAYFGIGTHALDPLLATPSA
jgi:SAM-dependent methyltransferase